MNDLRDLAALIRSRTPVIVIETMEESRAMRLVETIASERDLPLYRWSAATGLVARSSQPDVRYGTPRDATQSPRRLALVDDDTDHTPATGEIPDTRSLPSALKYIDTRGGKGLYVLLDIHPYLEDPVVLRGLREIALDHALDDRTLVLISPRISLPPKLARHAAHLSLSLPDEARIRELLENEFQLFEQSRGRPRRDTRLENAMVRYASGLCEEDVRELFRQTIRDDGRLTPEDLQRAVRYKEASLPGLSLEAPLETPDSVGGLLKLRRWIAQRRPIFLGEIDRPGLPAPKGVLIMGVQGTGKSLTAKVTAASWGLPLLKLDMGALYDKYQGETERKLREALSAAESMQPVVMWIDEIEKALSGGSSDQDGGVSRRVLGTLLTWMAERKSRIFIVATANDVQALPPELIRKGRFDELFFVDLPDAPARETIFRIHLSRHQITLTTQELRMLALASNGMSGAEIEQAVVSTLYEALPDNREPDLHMLLAELKRTRPLSVVMAEKIAQLRAWAQERCVMAD